MFFLEAIHVLFGHADYLATAKTASKRTTRPAKTATMFLIGKQY